MHNTRTINPYCGGIELFTQALYSGRIKVLENFYMTNSTCFKVFYFKYFFSFQREILYSLLHYIYVTSVVTTADLNITYKVYDKSIKYITLLLNCIK